jgi:hypothetical protein
MSPRRLPAQKDKHPLAAQLKPCLPETAVRDAAARVRTSLLSSRPYTQSRQESFTAQGKFRA